MHLLWKNDKKLSLTCLNIPRCVGTLWVKHLKSHPSSTNKTPLVINYSWRLRSQQKENKEAGIASSWSLSWESVASSQAPEFKVWLLVRCCKASTGGMMSAGRARPAGRTSGGGGSTAADESGHSRVFNMHKVKVGRWVRTEGTTASEAATVCPTCCRLALLYSHFSQI